MWVEVYALLLECKELIFLMNVIFLLNYIILNVSWRLEVYALLFGMLLYLILCRLKWVVLHSCQPNMIRLLSVSNGLGQVNLPY